MHGCDGIRGSLKVRKVSLDHFDGTRETAEERTQICSMMGAIERRSTGVDSTPTFQFERTSSVEDQNRDAARDDKKRALVCITTMSNFVNRLILCLSKCAVVFKGVFFKEARNLN